MTQKEQREVFASNLKRLIEKSGKSQVEVSDAIEVGRTTLCNWCNCTAVPSWDKIRKLADYFHVTPNRLVNPYDPKEEKFELMLELIMKLDEAKFDTLYSYVQFLSKEGD